MKRTRLFLTVAFLALAETVVSATGVTRTDGVFEAAGVGTVAPAGCVPVLVSNGELSLDVDYTGTMEPDKSRNWFPDVSVAQVWLQGRRKSPPQADLFGFGAFRARLAVDGRTYVAPDGWRQALDTRQAVTTCENVWAEGALKVVSEIFVPKEANVIVIRRTFAAFRPVRVDCAEAYGVLPDERMLLEEGTGPDGVILAGRTYGKKVFDFAIGAASSEGSFVRGKTDAKLSLGFALAAGETRTLDLAYAFADSRFRALSADAVRAEAAALARRGVTEREALRAAHVADWAGFWSRGEVVTPEPALNRFFTASLYTLRCNVSHWGFPVAVNRHAWSGRYFGFDEMFQAQAMAATGRFAESGGCAAWRRSLLDKAERRIGRYRKPGKWGGWLFWEMDEEGDCENCPPGFWEKHIFNHSTLARTMWEHYNYTGDVGYLKETAYPVMLAMARYLRNNWVYDGPDGCKYIGKCTDLERLGPARDRPFCTTCGAIDTLRLTAKAAAVIGRTDDETADFVRTAEVLVGSLPSKDGAYTVDVEAEQASVALLAGLFPFPVDDLDPEKCRKAADVILRDLAKYGNMYPHGKRTCPWYAGFISAAMSRLGEPEKAVAVLRDAADMLGTLGTVWEINEGSYRSHPNFATAAGNCVYAVTRLFLTEKDGEVELFRGVPPSWQDYSFRLPVPGGAWLSVAVRSGRLVRFDVTNPMGRPLPRFRVPGRIAGDFGFKEGLCVEVF